MKLSNITKKVEYPITTRKFLASNIVRFRSDVTKAISYRKQCDIPLQSKVLGRFNFN